MLALCVFGVLVIVLAPLPPFVMDLLIVTSITVSVVMFLAALFVRRPVDLTSFPTLLLGTTVFRLALNVASTRLILLGGDEGSHAAGRVIEAFGQIVVGGNFVVGIVVFSILVVINFVVITKGAGRVAEVAARFTLDAMPGKQMAIDAELNAGLIDEKKARSRRQEVAREAEFYGAMDGASKFTRGDAIAGMVITVVNVVGGVLIGVVQNGMPLAEAAHNYTILTIGDGLVGQIPALIVSTAAGVLVTRVTDENSDSLDGQLVGQLFRSPQVLGLTAVGLAAFAIVPGLRLPFLLAAGVMGLIAYNTVPDAAPVADPEAEPAREPGPGDLLRVEPLSIEVGVDLLYLVDEKRGGDLTQRIQRTRNQFATDLGVVLPPVHLRDNLTLEPGEYVVQVRGEEVGRGKVHARKHLALDPGDAKPGLKGVNVVDPVFGLPAVWIADNAMIKAQALGYTVVDVPTVVTTHFVELMHAHAHELYDGKQLGDLLERMQQTHGRLIDDLVPDPLPRHAVLRVFRNLIREGISVRDAQTVFEALADRADKTRDPDVLTELVRQRLARQISRKYAAEGTLRYIGMAPAVEEAVLRGLQTREGGVPVLVLDPELIRVIAEDLQGILRSTSAATPVVLAPPLARGSLQRMLERTAPRVPVISASELLPHVRLQSIGTIGVRDKGLKAGSANPTRG